MDISNQNGMSGVVNETLALIEMRRGGHGATPYPGGPGGTRLSFGSGSSNNSGNSGGVFQGGGGRNGLAEHDKNHDTSILKRCYDELNKETTPGTIRATMAIENEISAGGNNVSCAQSRALAQRGVSSGEAMRYLQRRKKMELGLSVGAVLPAAVSAATTSTTSTAATSATASTNENDEEDASDA